MQTKEKIALIGAIANPNLGDEALLQANLQLINKIYGKYATVYIFTKNASYTSLYENFSTTMDIDIIPVSFLHQITVKANYDVNKMRDYSRELFDYLDKKNSGHHNNVIFDSLKYIFEDIDVLHIIGGGYINSLWPDMLEEVNIASLLAKRFSVPYFFTGINAFSLDGNEKALFNEICNGAEFVDFRDSLELELVSHNTDKYQITVDDALFLDIAHQDKDYILKKIFSINKGKYVNLVLHSWQNFEDKLNSKISDVFIPFIKSLVSGKQVDYINILGFSTDDLALWNNHIVNLSEEIINKINFIDCTYIEPSNVKILISCAEFNIASRFHAAVFSLSSGIPILSIYFDKYYEGKVRSVHDMYNSRELYSIDNINLDVLINFISRQLIIRGEISSISVKNNIEKLYQKKVKGIIKQYRENLEDIDTIYNKIVDSNSYLKSSPKISVIVPVYNMESYLKQCLDSILRQSLEDIEIICIDDGSNDNTPQILGEYQWKEKRIKVISQKNSGVAYARNQGIKIATGEFLYFIDPDDWLPDNDVFKDLYNAAIDNQVFVCGGSFQEVNSEHGLIDTWSGSGSKYTFKENMINYYHEYQFDYGWVRFIYNREFLLKNNLNIPDRKFFEDPVFFVKTMSLAKRFYSLSRPVYCYRTGHHNWELSYEKTIDLLKGIRDILIIGRENEYNELIALEEIRLKYDYSAQIVKYLHLKDSGELHKLLEDINSLLNKDDQNILIDILSNFYQSEIHKINHYNNCLNQELLECKNELKRTFSSYNWRVGKSILYIPKKIIKLFK